MSSESRLKIIAAADIGTTRAKIAYHILSRAAPAQELQTSWSFRPWERRIHRVSISREHGFAEPTKLAYHRKKGRFLYGSGVEKEISLAINKSDPDELKPEDVLDLLKLGLDRSAQTESIRIRQREQRQKMPRKDNGAELSAIDMLAQYLAWLSGRAIAQFRVHLGIPLFDTINVDWVLAVPAEWDIAMEDYREAARQAGLGEVQLVTETEAAAAALISSEQREDRFEELVNKTS